LAQTAARVSDDIEQACSSIPASSRAYLRPLYVLAGLHAGLLQQIARINYDVGSARVDLGPVRKPWLAWRAARRAG
ncbi:MAG TPA: hypothetical protein VNA21_01170, partial [Steroidobacteraceae bacterium]|nr:hypothetical protein [Steroidobacteraceae bacterium]